MDRYRVAVRDSARESLLSIVSYLVEEGWTRAASRLVVEFEKTVVSLDELPERGTKLDDDRLSHQTRWLFIGSSKRPQYRLYYQIRGSRVVVVLVRAGSGNLDEDALRDQSSG